MSTATRGLLVMLAGAAGSGKSTLAGRRWPGPWTVSRDDARRMVSGRVGDQSLAALVDTDNLLAMVVCARLRRDRAVVVDSTGTAPGLRSRLLAVGREHGARCELVIVSAPLEVCLARNAARTGAAAVPAEAVTRQHAAVEQLIGQFGDGPAPWDDVSVVLCGRPTPAGDR